MSFDFHPTKKGFEYDFFPNDLNVELFEASAEIVLQETEQFKIVNGMNEFEFTFGEFLSTLKYMIMKYSFATRFSILSEQLNIFSIINGFLETKGRFSSLSSAFPHQTNKKYIYAIDANRDETVKFVFNLEKETITIHTNSNSEKKLTIYLNISDYNRIILKLFQLTNFGENNEKIKNIVSELETLSKKLVIYQIESFRVRNDLQEKYGTNFYQEVKDEATKNETRWHTSVVNFFSRQKL